mmetsp:Transcript_3619/g.7925  ORF Transcript_3619/g.7925 Transcript_3619/m.7925 type:complete len:391 (-) Transcript_3619:123-1295(-)
MSRRTGSASRDESFELLASSIRSEDGACWLSMAAVEPKLANPGPDVLGEIWMRALRTHAKRRRIDSKNFEGPGSELGTSGSNQMHSRRAKWISSGVNGSASSDGTRKQTPSKNSWLQTSVSLRRKAVINLDEDADSSSRSKRSNLERVGPEYQANVPDLSKRDEKKYVVPKLESELLWQPDYVPSHDLSAYLTQCESVLIARQGHGLGPKGEYRCLLALRRARKSKNDPYGIESAKLAVRLGEIVEGVDYELMVGSQRQRVSEAEKLMLGEHRSWSASECENFTMGMILNGKDFRRTQKDLLKERTTAELVSFYYMHYKQGFYQRGGHIDGDMYDKGTENLLKGKISGAKLVWLLSTLAVRNRDGIPAERRLERGLKYVRHRRNATQGQG